MSEILLINPRKRRRASTKRKRSASGRFVKTASRKRAAPRRRRRNPAPAALAANPRRRRSASRSVARRVTRRRRNPTARGIVAQLMPAVKGAAGAAITDIAYRFIPTPGPLAMLKGPLAPVTRVAVAFGVSQVARFAVGKRVAGEMLSGALTVIAYGLINEYVLSRIPMIGVGEYVSGLGYNDAAMSFDPGGGILLDPGMTDYSDEEVGVGEFISGNYM